MYFKVFKNVKVGKNCKIEWSADIYGNVKLGNNVYIGKNTLITGNIEIGDNTSIHNYTHLTTMKDASMIIGKECHIGYFSVIGSCNELVIEDYALFASGVKITNGNHGLADNPDDIIKNTPYKCQKMIIGKNTWLGFDVNVISGGLIGNNCVIGSKSLVNKEIPKNSVAVGIPAKVIKKREVFEK
jgi:acetyltransferase-like isoleucine patch superfamily enzyme